MKQGKDIADLEIQLSFDIPLYDPRTGEVPVSSGLNWGLARLNGAHTAEGDAYIRLPKEIIKEVPGLISPLDPTFSTPEGKRKRNSDPIELIWDDGTIMEALLEGEQKHDGKLYPKQLASYSSKTPFLNGKRISKKSILGRYLRNRLGVDVDDRITKEILDNYGRNTITLSLIAEGYISLTFQLKTTKLKKLKNQSSKLFPRLLLTLE